MDPIAVKFALVTLAIIIVISSLLIFVRRVVRKYRGKDDGRHLPRKEAIGLLVFGVVFIACLVFLPWVAFVLLIVAFGGSIFCFVRLPRDVKVLMWDSMFGSQVSRSRKIVSVVLIVGWLVMITIAFLDRLL